MKQLKHLFAVPLALFALAALSFPAFAQDTSNADVSFEVSNTFNISADDVPKSEWPTMPIENGDDVNSNERNITIQNNHDDAEIAVTDVLQKGNDPADEIDLYVVLTTDPGIGNPKKGFENSEDYKIWENNGHTGTNVGDPAYDLNDSGEGTLKVKYQLRTFNNTDPQDAMLRVKWTLRDA